MLGYLDTTNKNLTNVLVAPTLDTAFIHEKIREELAKQISLSLP